MLTLQWSISPCRSSLSRYFSPDDHPASWREKLAAASVIAPSGRYEQVLSFYAFANADDAGHFEIKGITPGRYKLFAFEELDPSSFGDPGFLKPYQASSEAFEIREGERIERKTPLIPAGTGGASD